MKELMQELGEAMVESATDELGDGFPEWQLEDTGYDTPIIGLTVTTQQSRDPNRSRNGGEYYGYAHFEIRPDGVEVWSGSSCELVSRAEEKARGVKVYPISLTPKGLERMAHLAEARALQQVAPDEALDPKVAAIMDAAIAMFGSPKAGIGQLKAAVREYEISLAGCLTCGKPTMAIYCSEECAEEN